MNQRVKKWLVRDIPIWAGLYILWILVFHNRSITVSRTMGIEFCYLVFIAFNLYITTYLLIPKLLNQKKYFYFILSMLLLIAITSWMRAEVAFYINNHFFHTPIQRAFLGKLYLNSALNIFIWTECLVAGKIIIDKISYQRYTESVEKEKIINELNFLRVQNNPHFLFNSLNSIYFQINKTNKDARASLMRLSEMLRYQLYECGSERISIEKEITFLKNYVELQKLRLNSNYTIRIDIPKNLRNFEIAPLLLMPLIENAFKYVSHFSEKDNEITIALGLEQHIFTCNVRNTTERLATVVSIAEEGGIGLTNLKRRLALLYPDRHELTIENHESYYNVKLTLTLDED